MRRFLTISSLFLALLLFSVLIKTQSVTAQEAAPPNALISNPWPNRPVMLSQKMEPSIKLGIDTFEKNYDPDDSCDDAVSIPTDGTVQPRTFQTQGDDDWASFQAIADTTYLVEARVPPDSAANVVLELYDACGTLPSHGQDNAFSPNARLQFRAPTDGTYYLRFFNNDPKPAGSEFVYHLSVQALPDTATPGAVVIVAGRLRVNDPLQQNIHQVTNRVYRFFRRQGYDDERIHYLATDLFLDSDGDGQADVDAFASTKNLQHAITQWATDQVSSNRPLTLYMVSHGGVDKFYLDQPRAESVTPVELSGWLDELEAAVPGVNVNVIVESPHSGSFIDLSQTLSQPGRVVISSTGANALAYASDNSALFSEAFLQALQRGMSLYGAFSEASWSITHPDQTPWLDDNGDGVANGSADGSQAQRRSFASAAKIINEWQPYIVQAEMGTVNDGEGIISAQVRDDLAVQSVWAVIYKPSYVPPSPDQSEELVQESLPMVMLSDADGDGVYNGIYEGFDENGTYRIVVYASDEEQLQARPQSLEVQVGGPTSTPTPSDGDTYEPDDTCEQASSISTDGTVQSHTFHAERDEDWSKFQATAGITYMIHAHAPTDSRADVILELYDDRCGFTQFRQNQSSASGGDVGLTFTPSTNGSFYLRILNANSAIYGSDVIYDLSIQNQGTLTPTPTPTATPTATPTTSNRDFETGDLTGWTTGGELPQSVTSDERYEGNFAALLGNPEQAKGFPNQIPAGRAYIEQEIQLPSNSSSQLSFWYRVISYDVMTGGQTDRIFDSFDVTINGELIHRDGNPDGSSQGNRYDSGWKQAVLDLSAYRGQTVTLRFAAWNREYAPMDGLDFFNTWTYVDQITLTAAPSTLHLPLLLMQPTPTPTPTPTSTPTPMPTPISPLINGDFEIATLKGWQNGGQLPRKVTSDEKHSGNFAALLGNPELGDGLSGNIPAGNAYIEQVIQVPSNGTPQLSFWYRVISYDTMMGCKSKRVFDRLDVTINEVQIHRAGNPDCNGQGNRYDSQWRQGMYDLSAYRGQTVTLRFAVWNQEYDGNGVDFFNTWAYLDDINITRSAQSTLRGSLGR